MTPESETMGRRVRALRDQWGLSIRELAVACKLNHSTLARVENDTVVAGWQTVRALADYFDSTTDYLIYGRVGGRPQPPEDREVLTRWRRIAPELRQRAMKVLDALQDPSEPPDHVEALPELAA